MARETYVNADGTPINKEEKNKQWLKRNLIIIGVFLFVVLVFFISRAIIRSNYCASMIRKVTDASISFKKETNELPKSEGDYITLDLEDLLENKKIMEKDVTVNKKVARGKIKITKYKKEYITTVELKDCDYCDSSQKKWSKETDKKPNKQIVDVIAYYNYRNKSTNYTNWTNYFTNDDLNTDISKKYNIRLPKVENRLPVIPKDAEIIQIEQEELQYYRYRDKKWKYYTGGGDYTDFFSSEQPSGFTSKDDHTQILTEWSSYSLNYPEKKSYRVIQSATAYKWYYMEKGKKIYYKNGEYAVEVLSDHKYVKDTKAGSATMYRYQDKQWRWYNGAARKYSGFSSTLPKGYTFRDDGLYTINNWSSWSVESRANISNQSYREEEVDTRYRYRIQYNVISLPVLKSNVKKTEFENTLHQTVDELLKRNDIKVELSYKFRYKK